VRGASRREPPGASSPRDSGLGLVCRVSTRSAAWSRSRGKSTRRGPIFICSPSSWSAGGGSGGPVARHGDRGSPPTSHGFDLQTPATPDIGMLSNNLQYNRVRFDERRVSDSRCPIPLAAVGKCRRSAFRRTDKNEQASMRACLCLCVYVGMYAALLSGLMCCCMVWYAVVCCGMLWYAVVCCGLCVGVHIGTHACMQCKGNAAPRRAALRYTMQDALYVCNACNLLHMCVMHATGYPRNSTYCLLLATCDLLFTTCCLLPATYCRLPST